MKTLHISDIEMYKNQIDALVQEKYRIEQRLEVIRAEMDRRIKILIKDEMKAEQGF